MKEANGIEAILNSMLKEAQEALLEAEKSIIFLRAMGQDVTKEVQDFEKARSELERMEEALKTIQK